MLIHVYFHFIIGEKAPPSGSNCALILEGAFNIFTLLVSFKINAPFAKELTDFGVCLNSDDLFLSFLAQDGSPEKEVL